MILNILIIVASFLVGAILYRARGGWPDIPRPIEQILFCSPVIYLIYLADLGYLVDSLNGLIEFAYWEALIKVLLSSLSVIAVLKGHGRNMDLGNAPKPNSEYEPEWYEGLISPLKGKLSEKWYDFVGISVSGLLSTLPLIFTGQILPSLAGALKGPAYLIGWDVKIPPFKIGKLTFLYATEWGEGLTGGLTWAALATYILYL